MPLMSRQRLSQEEERGLLKSISHVGDSFPFFTLFYVPHKKSFSSIDFLINFDVS